MYRDITDVQSTLIQLSLNPGSLQRTRLGGRMRDSADPPFCPGGKSEGLARIQPIKNISISSFSLEK